MNQMTFAGWCGLLLGMAIAGAIQWGAARRSRRIQNGAGGGRGDEPGSPSA